MKKYIDIVTRNDALILANFSKFQFFQVKIIRKMDIDIFIREMNGKLV